MKQQIGGLMPTERMIFRKRTSTIKRQSLALIVPMVLFAGLATQDQQGFDSGINHRIADQQGTMP